MNDIHDQIAAGEALQAAGRAEDAIAHFLSLAVRHPDHPQVIFALGGAYDSTGYESEAIPHYRRALTLGLAGDDLPRLAVQLGSSLRNIGEHTEAVQVLQAASDQFPDHRALRMFLALSRHSAGQHDMALADLLDLILNIPDTLEGYQRALRYYADALRGTGADGAG